MSKIELIYVDEIVGTNAYIDGKLQPKVEGRAYKILADREGASDSDIDALVNALDISEDDAAVLYEKWLSSL